MIWKDDCFREFKAALDASLDLCGVEGLSGLFQLFCLNGLAKFFGELELTLIFRQFFSPK